MQEKVELSINEQLAKMINQLIFQKEKLDEEKLKEKLSHIIRPACCDSLVTTKVYELIWQRFRPQTWSFELTLAGSSCSDLRCQVSHNPIKNAR